MRNPFLCLVVLGLLATCATPPPPAPPAPEPIAPQVQDSPPAAVEYVVSPEKKQASLVQIRSLVDKLNILIERKNFQDWKAHLDQDYVRIYGDPNRLREYSANSPFLRQFDVKLKNLEDYFKFVVVPSRANTTVDDISFVDENRVNVWTVVDNERVLLYLLKLYDKEWKISSW